MSIKHIQVEERFGVQDFESDECARVTVTWEDKNGVDHKIEIYDGGYKDGVCVNAYGIGRQLVVTPIASNVICVRAEE